MALRIQKKSVDLSPIVICLMLLALLYFALAPHTTSQTPDEAPLTTASALDTSTDITK
jgi:hypothetical protein